MSTDAHFYIVKPDAPQEVVWHDPDVSPHFIHDHGLLYIYTDTYDDFEYWVRIGIHYLFFRTNPETLEEIDLFRLSNIIPDNVIELLTQWMDDYHTDRPKLHGNSYHFWTFVDYTRETLPKDAQQDTLEYRAAVLEFIREAIGKRLVVRVY